MIIIICCCVVELLSHVQLFVTPWTAACKASQLFTISWSLCKFMSVESMMLTISSSVAPFFSCPQSSPASGSFLMNRLFAAGGQSIGTSASASGLFALGLNGLILLSKALPESSPAPQFKRINSSSLSFLYGPALTSVHDYWKNQ